MFVQIRLFFVFFLAGNFCFAEQIAILGSGYVGLITSAIFNYCGHEVLCIDIDEQKIAQLQKNILPIYEPGLADFLWQPSKKKVKYTKNLIEAANYPVIYICLATPSDEHGDCDCSFIDFAIEQILTLSPGPQLICIKSTVPPGTLKRLKQRVIDKRRRDIELVYNPEFMRQGSALEDIFNKNPLVIGGDSKKAIAKIESLYQPLIEQNPAMKIIKTNYETAELIKYGWNGFSALRIAYFNELSRLCRNLSVDVFTLIEGISASEKLLPTKEIKPGCGFGGSCLPKDTKALARLLERHEIYPSLIHQTISSNRKHIEDVVACTIKVLGDIKGKEIAILGLAFKANTDDIREAPGIQILEEFIKRGAIVRAYDLFAAQKMKEYFPKISYFDSVYDLVKNADCMVVLTDSNEIKEIELDRIASVVKQKILIDPRNVFDPKEAKLKGFKLVNLGRI